MLESQILPDLQGGVDAGIHPIIKVDAIKYLMLFRSQVMEVFLMFLSDVVSRGLLMNDFGIAG